MYSSSLLIIFGHFHLSSSLLSSDLLGLFLYFYLNLFFFYNLFLPSLLLIISSERFKWNYLILLPSISSEIISTVIF